MLRRRKLLILVPLIAAVLCATAWIYWRWQTPPKLARTLPDGSRLLYIDLRPLRLWDWNKSKPPQLDGDYQPFVDQTGIRFEHDLEQAAVAWRNDDAGDVESAAVFSGRFDPSRLQKYLQSISSATDTYRRRAIYSIPHEGHVVRAAVLDDKTVAVTNMPASDVIPGMIERWDRSLGEPALLSEYYRRIPAGSLAWLLNRFSQGSTGAQLPGGLSFSFLENTVAVVSARYNGNLLLRADVLTATEADARRLIDSASTFLSLYRGISKTVARGGDGDVKAALDSIRIQQEGGVAVFTASLSQNFLKKVGEEVQPQVLPAAPSPAPSPNRDQRGQKSTSRR